MWPDVDVDVLEDGRYVVECSPEYKLWVKRHFGGGVQAKAKWDARTDEWNVSATAGGAGGLRKVKFTPRTGKLELHTRKLEMGLLKASGVLTHDVQNRQVNFAWRLTSKWSADRGKVGRKEKIPLGSGLTADYKWSCSFSLPEMSGGTGGSGDGSVQVDKGKFRYTIKEIGLGLTLGKSSDER